jgi:hypothetical protein
MQKKYWNIIESIMGKKNSISKNLPLYFIQDSDYNGGKINYKEKAFRIFDDKQLGYNYQISTISLLKLFDSFMKKKNNQRNNNQVFYMKASESASYYKKLHKNNSK